MRREAIMKKLPSVPAPVKMTKLSGAAATAASSAAPATSSSAATARSSTSSSSSVALPAGTADAARTRRPLEQKYHTVAEARSLMPQGRNCGSIAIHELNRSWLAQYPTDAFPKSRSRVFDGDDVESHVESLRV